MQEDGIVFDEIAGVNMIEYYRRYRDWANNTGEDQALPTYVFDFCTIVSIIGASIILYFYWKKVIKNSTNKPFWSGLK